MAWFPSRADSQTAMTVLSDRGINGADASTAWRTFVNRSGGIGTESLWSLVDRLPTGTDALTDRFGSDAIRVALCLIDERGVARCG